MAVPKRVDFPLWKEAADTPRRRIPRQVSDPSHSHGNSLFVEQAQTASASSRDSALLERVAAPATSDLPMPRLLIVFAHPDDEVLAMGARLERLAASRLLTVTDGAPSDGADARHHGFASLEDYRRARQNELAAALAHAGVSLETVSFGTAFPPSPVADQTAALHLLALTHAIASAIKAFAPEAILTHPYEGGHPDHDACAFAVHTAVRLRSRPAGEEGQTSAETTFVPVILETPSYHAGDNGSMQTGVFLGSSASTQTIGRDLSAQEQANKQTRLACFRSQAETLAQFGTGRELFRVAPHYDFTKPPHAGQLFFEQFPWGMAGVQFRSLAAEAIQQLFPPPATRKQPKLETDLPS
ncbi:MAG: PIG-L deacetylase family protein [Janthinobacterium lividum]